MHDKQSLGARLLVPIFLIIAMITIALLLLVHTISNRVHENYMRFALAAEGADVDKMLSSAATELTAARLLDNPMVVEAKQQSVLESIRLSWFHTQHDGFITDADGHVMLSTLSPEQVKAIAARRVDGYFSADHASESFRCYSHIFPLWQWTVITVNRHTVTYLSGTDIALLVPIVGLGSLLMAGGFFFVYREKLRKPVAAMVTSVATESDVQATGIAELDRIGDAVNSAMAGLKARTAELERELQERKKAEDSARSKDEHISFCSNRQQKAFSALTEAAHALSATMHASPCSASRLMTISLANTSIQSFTMHIRTAARIRTVSAVSTVLSVMAGDSCHR